MQIKGIYAIPDCTKILICLPDDTLYTFVASPYRIITHDDLTPISRSVPTDICISAMHATEYMPNFKKLQLQAYGLTILDEE